MENTELIPEEKTPVVESDNDRVWDENHKKIMDCIRNYMQRKYESPTVSFISEQTGLSRYTVRKHINNFSSQANFHEHASMYKFLTTDIFRHLYTSSLSGDTKAARLYMELMGLLKYNALVENNFVYSPPRMLKLGDIDVNEEFISKMRPELFQKLEETLNQAADEMRLQEIKNIEH